MSNELQMSADMHDRLSQLAIDGLKVEPEYKQWFLEQIALKLGVNLDALLFEQSREPYPKPSCRSKY